MIKAICVMMDCDTAAMRLRVVSSVREWKGIGPASSVVVLTMEEYDALVTRQAEREKP